MGHVLIYRENIMINVGSLRGIYGIIEIIYNFYFINHLDLIEPTLNITNLELH